MLPIEAASVLGSLAGIGEIAKATFGDGMAGTGGARSASDRPGEPSDAFADDRAAAAYPMTRRVTMWTCIVSLGSWNWFIAGAVAAARSRSRARHLHAVARAVRLLGRRSSRWSSTGLAGAVRRLRGTLGRADPDCGGGSPARRGADRQPFLNRRADGLSAACSLSTSRSSTAAARCAIDDTVWRVPGPDCPAGSRVKLPPPTAPTSR